MEACQRATQKKYWHEASFDQVRSSLKDKYGLSSKELSKAISLIKTHYEFAPLIGEKPELLGLNTIHLISFLDQSVRLNDISPGNQELTFGDDSSTFDDVLKSLKRNKEMIAQAWDEFKPIMNPEMLAGLKALFYFAGELNFSEEYIMLYGHELEDARAAFKLLH